MRELVFEILLRLLKALAAAVVGIGFWLLAISVLFSLSSAADYIRGFLNAIAARGD